MGESLIERRRVQEEGLRVVNCGNTLETTVIGVWKVVGNYVPAPAVIRRPQALSGFIGRKGCVGCFLSRMLNRGAQHYGRIRY
jgi:hypothetical protein